MFRRLFLRLFPRVVFRAFGCLFASVGLAGSASAVVPPYAEEWLLPAGGEEVEVDPSGRVWVACADDFIRVYTPTGGQLLFAFGGTGTEDGEFNTPYGIAFDPSGDAYICDYVNARLQKFTSEGVFLLSWWIPSDRADHVAVDAVGDVYVTGFNDLSVHKYSPDGTPILDWTMNGGIRNSGILVAHDVVSVVGWDIPVVEQFATDGTFLGTFDAMTTGGTDIEIDALDQLWVVDFGGQVVRTFSTDGTPIDVLGSFGSGPGQFNEPQGVAIGPDGSVYVCDYSGARVQRFGAPVSSTPDGAAAVPAPLAFGSIAPNPCRESVEITYALAHAEQILLTVTDVTGRTVATLENRTVSAGEHRVVWGARDDRGRPLAAGVYLARLTSGGTTRVARLVVVG